MMIPPFDKATPRIPEDTKRAIEKAFDERLRQINELGWTADHDDEHKAGELAAAASCYALHPLIRGDNPPEFWPWEAEWWKPTPDDREREIVKAIALLLAQLEVYDRAKRKVRLDD